jgi:hypothetical protein
VFVYERDVFVQTCVFKCNCIWRLQLQSPDCVPRISRGSRPFPRGSVDALLWWLLLSLLIS